MMDINKIRVSAFSIGVFNVSNIESGAHTLVLENLRLLVQDDWIKGKHENDYHDLRYEIKTNKDLRRNIQEEINLLRMR